MDQHVVNEEDLSEHATNERIQNGSLRGPLHDGGEEQTDENIFLFIPNLIGSRLDGKTLSTRIT